MRNNSGLLSQSALPPTTIPSSKGGFSSGVIPTLANESEINPKLNTSFSGNVQLPPVAEIHQRRQKTASGVRKSSVPTQERNLLGSAFTMGMSSNPSIPQDSVISSHLQEYSYNDDKLALARTYLGNGSSGHFHTSTRAGTGLTNASPLRNGSRLLGSECQSKRMMHFGRDNFSWMGSMSELGDFHQINEDYRRKPRALLPPKKKRQPVKKLSGKMQQQPRDPYSLSVPKRRKVIIDNRLNTTMYDPPTVMEKRRAKRVKIRSSSKNNPTSYSGDPSLKLPPGQASDQFSLNPTSPEYVRQGQFSPFRDPSFLSGQPPHGKEDLEAATTQPESNRKQTAYMVHSELPTNRVVPSSVTKQQEDALSLLPADTPINAFKMLFTNPKKKKRQKRDVTPIGKKTTEGGSKSRSVSNKKPTLRERLKQAKHKTSILSELSQVYDTGRSNSRKSSRFEPHNPFQSVNSQHSFSGTPKMNLTHGPRLVLGLGARVFSPQHKSPTLVSRAHVAPQDLLYMSPEQREEVERQQRRLYLLRQRQLEQAEKKVREVMTDNIMLERDLATYESIVSEEIKAVSFLNQLEDSICQLVKPVLGPVDDLQEISMLRQPAILQENQEDNTAQSFVDFRKDEPMVANCYELLREIRDDDRQKKSDFKIPRLHFIEMESMRRVQTQISGVFSCIELLESKIALRISCGLKLDCPVVKIPYHLRPLSIGKLLSLVEYDVVQRESEDGAQATVRFEDPSQKPARRLNCMAWLKLGYLQPTGGFQQNPSYSEENQSKFHTEESVSQKTEEIDEITTPQCQQVSANEFLCKAAVYIPRYDETQGNADSDVQVSVKVGWSRDLPASWGHQGTVRLKEEMIRSYGITNRKLRDCVEMNLSVSSVLLLK